MSLVCVSGCRECNGCMDCQSFTLEEEDAIERSITMNKERREKLTKLQEQLDGISTDIEALRDEEQEAMDNMPESLQGSERYEAMESAVSYLDDVLSNLEEASSCIESAME